MALLLALMPILQSTVLAQGGGVPRRKDAGIASGTKARPDTTEIEVEKIETSGGPVRVFLQLNAPAVSEVMAKSGRGAASTQASKISSDQQSIESAFTAAGLNVKITDRLRTAVNGFIAVVDPKQIRQIAAVPGVKTVYKANIIDPDLTTTIPKLGIPPIWASGYTGSGSTVAVIDDGIDYKHANFGGNSGTTWATRPTKIIDGYDFVGDAYDARVGNSPTPDSDPYTCPNPPPAPIYDPADAPIHHGTHVAGIVGGLGVTSGGATFAGPYDATVPFTNLLIGPGVAPAARFYIFRVFGCYGSTDDLNITAAIDRAMDPDQNGDPSDHANVINMSLGSNYGVGYGPEQISVENATQVGITVVAAAGNAADSYYIVSDPGDTGAAISVAGTSAYVPSVTVAAGVRYGSGASFGPRFTTGGITGTIQVSTPANGCGPLTGFTAGNIARINRGTCEFDDKVWYAQQAGAIAVVVCNNAAGAPIAMGTGVTAPPTSPSLITIPSTMVSLADCPSVTGTATVRVDPTANAIYSSTSRGPRRSTVSSRVVLKPDVAAPGENVISSIGWNSVASYSGTSMATPHIAGYVALLHQQNPSWTPGELKALVMNTSTVDIPVTVGVATPLYGPGRMGVGRIDPANAFNLSGGGPKVIAYDQASPELVSVSFGLIEAVGAYTQTRTIELRNKGTSSVTYNVGLQNVVTEVGSSVAVSASSVTVPAGGTATVNVTVSGNPNTAGSFGRDASVANSQGGLLREWLPEVTGYVTFTAASQPTLRVSYHAIVRPAAQMTAQDVLTLPNTSGSASVVLSGTGFSTSPTVFSGSTTNVASLVSPFNLAYTNTTFPISFDVRETSFHIQNIGVTSDRLAQANLAATQIFFAITTPADWATPKSLAPYIHITTSAGNFCLGMPRLTVSSQQADVFLSSLYAGDCATSAGGFWDFANPTYGGVTAYPMHSYLLNNNTIVLAVPASGAAPSLGLTAGETFTYQVELASYDYGTVDISPVLSYSPDNDPLSFVDASGAIGGPFPNLPWFIDQPGSDDVPVDYNLSLFSGTNPLRILLVHYQNAQAYTRAELVCVNGPGLPVAAGCANATGPLVGDPGVTGTVNAAGSAGSGVTELGGPLTLPSTGYSHPTSDNNVAIAILLFCGLAAIGMGVIALRRRAR